MTSAQGPGLDEGLENLERFNGMVAQAVATLEEDAQRLDAHGQALERLASSGAEALDALQAAAADGSRATASGRSEAEKALEGLGGALETLEGGGLTEAGQQLGEASDEVKEQVASGRDAVEEASDELETGGFEPATAAADALDSELDHVRQEAMETLAALMAELAEAQEAVLSAETETGAATTQVVDAAETERAELGTIEELAAYVTGTYVPDLQAAVDMLETDVREAYASLVSDGEAAHERFVEEAEGLVESAAERVETDGQQELAGALEDVLENALPTVSGELQETDKALSLGAEVTDAAAALADPLVWAKSVVAEVDRLLDAMKGA